MRYSISKANLEKDRIEIDSLWKRNFNNSRGERYSWIYENNPSGPATCLLVKDSEQNAVIGATALFPRRMLINGKYFTAGIAGDFVVDESHRVLGPALSLQKSAISNCDGEKFDILYGFPNKKSEPVLLKAGYKILGEAIGLTKPLKSYYYLQGYFNIPVITKILSHSIDLVMKYLSKEIYYRGTDEYSFETPSSFDTRFDDLWKRMSPEFPIIGERTSLHLTWRYVQSPHKDYQVFALIRKKSREVLGYIVYYIVENKSYIDDLLSFNTEEILDSLLSEFLLYQRKKGIDSVTINCLCPQLIVNKLKKYGFSMRGGANKIMIYAPPDSRLMPYLLERENWYLMPGDNDI